MERKLKDSGIPWIGAIPEHWEVEKGKNLFSLRTSKGNETLEHLAATQTHGMYPQRLLDGVVQVAANTDYTQFRTVHINDYVISLRSFQGGFEISNYEGVCSPAYQVFYSKVPICHNYFKILFKSVSFIEFMNSLTVGIREGKNIQYVDFSLSYLPVPPLSEQEAISAYLDEKCGEIDELIAVEQKMISDLEAYRQAVITEAVTHGLNPYAPLRDSGIPWIGQIPEHWEITRVAKICYEHYVTNKIEHNQNLLSLSYGNIKRKNINTVDGLLPASFDTYQIVDEGNIVLRLTDLQNDKRSLRVGHVEERGIITSAYVALGMKPYVYSKYMYFLLYTADICKVFYSFGGGVRQSGKWDDIASLIISLPPLAEQKEIADYLDAKCAEIAELIKVKQDKIETMKQYRQSLIFEAVTGKINID